MTASKKYIYFFGPKKAEGNAKMKNLLGGKGANIAEMINLGIPVPSGFTISTEACVYYLKHKGAWPQGLDKNVNASLARLEKIMGKGFGDPKNPLLISVRSGARASMPGMMDTVLNLGLNAQTVAGLIAKTGNPRFAYDSYRRFITMFGDVVLGIHRHKFEEALTEKKKERGAKFDTDLTAEDLQAVAEVFKKIVKEETGKPFPENPKDQLKLAIEAVFRSWDNKRAREYRALYGIPESWGTAVNVQSMVFGNMGATSGTGVAFTRDPGTGEHKFYGEFLANAQGEDVVAGIRTPVHIDEMKRDFPKPYADLVKIYKKLEKHYRDMLDIEFTVEENVLYMLQARVGKRTAGAAIKIAIDMVKEKLITKEEAVLRIDPKQLDQLLHKTLDPKEKPAVLTKGLAASPGAAVGRVVFTAEEAQEWAERGEKVILVRQETSPEDIGGMHASQGILTVHGGMTSHAAVVARGMGKTCVAGAGEISISAAQKKMKVRDIVISEGDFITLDGSTGRVIQGKAKLVEPEIGGDFQTLMAWADKIRKLNVRANADTPLDAKVARQFGAEGIGLCRTEHMFFKEDRILAVRQMILAETDADRRTALKKILPMQRHDFEEIFEVMNGLPVTIRLLDPPLHEFLPKTEEDIEIIAKSVGKTVADVHAKVERHHELNPMLGHRGCRLGITYPEIYDIQIEAIFEAACTVAKKKIKVFPEIMVPLVADVTELKAVKTRVLEIAKEVFARNKQKVAYKIGTMIELPRAALTADAIAAEAEFFSFGTNDLTQTTMGISRDDAFHFLPTYVSKGLFPEDPFVSIDINGVGALVKMGTDKGRKVRKDLKVGICGEHGGDPASVEFCHKTGLNYVSCSPYRVPLARLAAAHASIKEKLGEYTTA